VAGRTSRKKKEVAGNLEVVARLVEVGVVERPKCLQHRKSPKVIQFIGAE